jgi:hypothetical protein
MGADMDFKIETEIPMPSKRVRDKYPLADMQVGQSFFVPAEKVQNLREAISQRKRRGGTDAFTVRKNEGGHRCWRIE